MTATIRAASARTTIKIKTMDKSTFRNKLAKAIQRHHKVGEELLVEIANLVDTFDNSWRNLYDKALATNKPARPAPDHCVIRLAINGKTLGYLRYDGDKYSPSSKVEAATHYLGYADARRAILEYKRFNPAAVWEMEIVPVHMDRPLDAIALMSLFDEYNHSDFEVKGKDDGMRYGTGSAEEFREYLIQTYPLRFTRK